MRYVMKEKIWSLRDTYVIRDEDENEVYRVVGKLFSFGDVLSFQDADGNERLKIDQKLLSWGPTYEILRDGQQLAMVKKKLFTFFSCKFMVDVPGPDDLEASGGFLEHEYEFERQGRRVANVSKKYFSWSDTYGIDVADGEDDELILASAVVIDLVCHEQEHS